MSSEDKVVKLVERSLNSVGRYYVNVYGGGHTVRGVPDFLTSDRDNIFTGIECKSQGFQPVYNQFEHAQRILMSGGRFIVAFEDFDLDKLDSHNLPMCKIPTELEELIVFKMPDKRHSVELFMEV